MLTLLKNCHLISPELELYRAFLLLRDAWIKDILPAGAPLPEADRVYELAGQITVPGFIDIHCHGRGGADFCDGTPAAFNTIGRGKLAEGVTGFLATTMTVDLERLETTFAAAAEYCRHPTGAKLLGIHLEGPFINPDCAGAQNPAFLRLPDIALIDRLNRVCPIRKVSFSPELPGGVAFCLALAERGIMPSGAHSAADYSQFRAAEAAGMKHLTHFCNVMTPVHHLRFGMVGGGLLADDVYVEIIADGIHLCPEMIELIFALKTADRVMLITDAMCGSAMPDGNYDLGGLPVSVVNGKAQLANGTVAGSTLQMHQALRRAVGIAGLPLQELIKTTAWNQAVSLRFPKLGKLAKGYRADIVILNERFEPQAVWLGGQLQNENTVENICRK
ncbi:MAG: N-acetylglucosamine-6-phosphate deacetylase [Victivallaceae bacterium]|nr:N-acetylglucosamine-6-phosphate deacetylase [Victivallaceae bacterium]